MILAKMFAIDPLVALSCMVAAAVVAFVIQRQRKA